MNRYIKSLDGLRGAGILFVLFSHFFATYAHPWLGFSWVWVEMFFVQSGFLITTILLGDRDLGFADFSKRFYWRRALRILPPYVAYVGIFTLSFLLFRKPIDLPKHLPYLATYTYNFTRLVPGLHADSYYVHLWSLSVEEQFYLVWPLVIYFLSRRRLRQVLVFFIVMAPVCRGLLAAYLSSLPWFTGPGSGFGPASVGEATYGFTLSQWDGFAYGAAIPVFGLRERIRHPGRWAIALSCLLVVAGLANLIASGHTLDFSRITTLGLQATTTTHLQHVWSYSLVNLIFMPTTLHVLKPDYKGLFTAAPLVRI